MDTREVLELGVLGLLAEEPATLETLRDRFNHNFSRYQFAGYGSLGPLLDQLRDRGHITGTQTLRVTNQGHQHLRELLRAPVEDVRVPEHRSHMFVKLGLLHHLPTDDERAELARLEEQFHEALETVHEIANAHGNGDSIGHRRALFRLQKDVLETHRGWIADRRRALSA